MGSRTTSRSWNGWRRVVATMATTLAASLVAVLVPTVGQAAQLETPGPSWYTDGWVRDLVRVGNVIYAGGEFGSVTDGAGRTVARSNVAAFDALSGELLPWAPVVDGPVMALEASPDGSHLYLGGDFRTVNDVSRKRLVAVDQAGAVQTDFEANTGGRVLDLIHHNGQLLVAGELVSVDGRARTLVALVDDETGALDETWVPAIDGGSVRGIELSPDGAHLYIGGNFFSVDGVADTAYAARIRLSDARVDGSWRPGADMPVFDIEAVGSDVYLAVGGLGYENNRLDRYSAADADLIQRYLGSGDVQDLELRGDILYVGGHFERIFGGLPRIQLAAIDVTDGHITDFAPDVVTEYGVWKILAGPEGLWLGGEFTEVEGEERVGYAFLPNDDSPEIEGDLLLTRDHPWRYFATGDSPSANTTAWAQPGYDDAAWSVGVGEIGFGNDDERTVIADTDALYLRTTVSIDDPGHYDDIALRLLADAGGSVLVNGVEVMRHNLPPGALTDETLALSGKWTTLEKTWAEAHIPSSRFTAGINTIAVEIHGAYDTPGDMSFWFEVVGRRTGHPLPPGPDPTEEVTVIAPGSTWSYLDDGSLAGTAWRQIGFDHGAWPTGTASFGFGDGDEITEVEPGHITYRFHRTFTLDQMPARATLGLLADDGAAVYINGVEAVRDNLPAGPIDGSTKALGSKWGDDERSFVEYTIDPAVLIPGVNTIAVSVHNVWSGNGDLSFDLALVTSGVGDGGGGGGGGGAGTPVTFIPVDAWWRFLDDGSEPGASWAQPGFDDEAWASGSAPYGFGDGDEATVVEAGHRAYFFRERFAVDTIPSSVTLSVAYDDGITVHVNGQEVARRNVADGATVTADTVALGSRWGADETTPELIDIDPSLLMVGDNTLAISVHNVWSGNGDLSLDVELTGIR